MPSSRVSSPDIYEPSAQRWTKTGRDVSPKRPTSLLRSRRGIIDRHLGEASLPDGTLALNPPDFSRKIPAPRMAAPSSTSRPNWQRNRVFRFFASLKLAVVLLAVLIIGAIAGTLYESTFDAKVARAYVYGAPWFNIWLLSVSYTHLTL